MVIYRRPSRQAHCRHCRGVVKKGEIALSSWIRYGWGYMHIKCAMDLSRMYHCLTQPAVTPKEAVKATRQAVADMMLDRMKGNEQKTVQSMAYMPHPLNLSTCKGAR